MQVYSKSFLIKEVIYFHRNKPIDIELTLINERHMQILVTYLQISETDFSDRNKLLKSESFKGIPLFKISRY